MAIDFYEEKKTKKYFAYKIAHDCKNAVLEWTKKGKLFNKPIEIGHRKLEVTNSPIKEDPKIEKNSV